MKVVTSHEFLLDQDHMFSKSLVEAIRFFPGTIVTMDDGRTRFTSALRSRMTPLLTALAQDPSVEKIIDDVCFHGHVLEVTWTRVRKGVKMPPW